MAVFFVRQEYSSNSQKPFDKFRVVFPLWITLFTLTPSDMSMFTPFINKLTTTYPLEMWIKEQLFQDCLFGKLNIQQREPT